MGLVDTWGNWRSNWLGSESALRETTPKTTVMARSGWPTADVNVADSDVTATLPAISLQCTTFVNFFCDFLSIPSSLEQSRTLITRLAILSVNPPLALQPFQQAHSGVLASKDEGHHRAKKG
jgi:hypothetical protein